MSASIPHRRLGNESVPSIGLGLFGLSLGYGAVGTDKERLKVLDAAYASGSTFWDTANEVYGDSELLIGKWFKLNPDKRSKIFLATKFGANHDRNQDFVLLPQRGDPEYVKKECQKSLERLGVDYIDSYYQHRVDANTPIEKTVQAMAELVKEGKVKYLGLSECTPSGLRRAHSVHPISALEIEFSPIEIPPKDLLDTARELGTRIVAYSPLGRGFLTGNIHSTDDLEVNDVRRTIPRLQVKENVAKVMKLVDTQWDWEET